MTVIILVCWIDAIHGSMNYAYFWVVTNSLSRQFIEPVAFPYAGSRMCFFNPLCWKGFHFFKLQFIFFFYSHLSSLAEPEERCGIISISDMVLQQQTSSAVML